MTGWRLLLTRPADESTVLAGILDSAGVFSSSLPLLEIEALPVSDRIRTTIRMLGSYAAVIVVSKPAARLAVDLLKQYSPQLPSTRWFSVGAATAQILTDSALEVFTPEKGDDSEALLALPAFQAVISRPGAKVLILRGEGGRELLAEHLRSQGASVDYVELYRRLLPVYPPTALMQQVQAERLNGLVVSSGQGFEHLHQLAGQSWSRLAQLPLFVPSPRVAQMALAAGARTVVDCRGASAAALLAALREQPVPAV